MIKSRLLRWIYRNAHRYTGAGFAAAYARYKRGFVPGGGGSGGSYAIKGGDRFRIRRRGGRTRTRTRRKRRRRSGQQNIWSGDSHVTIPTKARKTHLSKFWKSMCGKLKTEFNQTGRISGSSNSTQQVSFIQHFPIAVISELVNRTTLGSATSAAWLENMQCYLTLLNQDVNDCTIWIYSLILRNDVGAVGINPVDDWARGLQDEGGASTDYQIPYSSPFQSKKFTTRWKVHKVQRFVLSSGAQHIHHVSMYPKHKINKERYTNTGSPTGTGGAVNGVNYLTACTMIVVLGGLTNSSGTKTDVGFGETALDFAACWRYQSHGMTDDSTTYYKNVTWPTLQTPQIIQEKTGLVQALTSA